MENVKNIPDPNTWPYRMRDDVKQVELATVKKYEFSARYGSLIRIGISIALNESNATKFVNASERAINIVEKETNALPSDIQAMRECLKEIGDKAPFLGM